jgi:hypothetical protein
MNYQIRSSPALLATAYPSFEDVKHHPCSGSWVMPDVFEGQTTLHPVQSILTAVRRADVMLLAVEGMPSRCLAVSPYPVLVGSTVFAHFVTTTPPRSNYQWQPWVGGTWRMW